MYTRYLIILILFLASCLSPIDKQPVFENDVPAGPKPWTSEEFELEEEDFTFAIIADLTGGERDGIFSVAVAQLNRLDPTFVISVGDLIEGGTEDSLQLKKEWQSFDSRAGKLNMPFFYLGGNHDLTNSVMRGFWKKKFGVDYYHFVYEDVLFLMLNSEVFTDKRLEEINLARKEAYKVIRGEVEGEFADTEYANMIESQTGEMSDTQFNYFQEVLNRHPEVKWTFVVMHKPLWLRADGHGLERLEEALANRPYTVINGHQHSFSYRVKNNRDYIMLATTGGFQNAQDPHAFDHITLVRMAAEPVITHLRLDGILDKTGAIPLGGDSLKFQASKPN